MCIRDRVGTAGHVDHGKTCLIKALTGTDTDRLKEEQKRGITIELGFANLPNDAGIHIGIIDVPGHEKFVKNMLAGIGGIDLVLLVVALDEGVMPQTVEHFEILKMLHIKQGIVVFTKADLVDEMCIRDRYKTKVYVVETKNSAAGMRSAVATMAPLALKLAKGEKLGSSKEEGYMPNGIRVNFFEDKRGSQRARCV